MQKKCFLNYSLTQTDFTQLTQISATVYTYSVRNPIIADTLGCKAHTENKLVIPVFQTGCMETQEFEDHVQHTWSAVPPAACSSSVLNLRRMPH